MKNNTSKLTDSAIAAMLTAPTVQSELMQAALEQINKENRQQKIDAVKQALNKVQRNTAMSLEILRTFRKIEGKAKEYLVSMAAAESQFHQDADVEAYQEAIKKAAFAFLPALNSLSLGSPQSIGNTMRRIQDAGDIS